ncbi:MAG: 2-C-methyl-D-erythritol 4-phosphate cytidylyltransferase [Coriobacteriales bacterium]|nr:2-C-methyl-D-erythritol 4-phosphate cytidylyltransferase [Coriobacteriales bacterium]
MADSSITSFESTTYHFSEFTTIGDAQDFLTPQKEYASSGKLAKKPCCCAVILAGGRGTRFKQEGGKLLFPILDKPLLTWSLQIFDATPEVGEIIVVCPEDSIDLFKKFAIEPYPFITPISFAHAGSIRQESAMNGVNKVPLDYEFIAIHDGARPLVAPSMVTHLINLLKGDIDAEGAVLGHEAIDTIKVVEDKKITGTPDRNLFWVAQTPQIFRADICRRAYSTAMEEGFVGTDDSSLVERLGARVIMESGPRDNIKLTVPEDAATVIAALKARLENSLFDDDIFKE